MVRRLLLVSALVALLAALTAAAATAAALGPGVAVERSAAAAKRASVGTPGGCPVGVPLSAPSEVQEQAMLCLTNSARERFGEAPLEPLASLEWSATQKSGDLLSCDEFAHTACGRDFDYWIGQTGYLDATCWRVGENIAWGAGEYGTVDSIFRAWMRSPTHRENILGNYTQTGVDLQVGKLGDFTGTRVWTQHFGSTECLESQG